MTVTTVKKFNWPFIDDDGETRTRVYFAGQAIDDQDAAAFAKMAGYGEERGEQTPARAPMNAPDNKAQKLETAGGENKAGKQGKQGKQEKRAKSDEGTLVLGSEDEVEQDPNAPA